MEQDSKELDVPWLKIMHAGFNVGFRWAFTSVVLGILGFLMSNGVEDSIRVILWSPIAMIAMGILFAFLGTFYDELQVILIAGAKSCPLLIVFANVC